MHNYNPITKIEGRQGKQDMNNHSKSYQPESGIQQVMGQNQNLYMFKINKISMIKLMNRANSKWLSLSSSFFRLKMSSLDVSLKTLISFFLSLAIHIWFCTHMMILYYFLYRLKRTSVECYKRWVFCIFFIWYDSVVDRSYSSRFSQYSSG